MPHSPEQEEFANRVKQFPGEVQAMDEGMLSRYLRDAPSFRNCFYLFWTMKGAKFLITYRTDRRPLNEEVFPIMECLFDGMSL